MARAVAPAVARAVARAVSRAVSRAGARAVARAGAQVGAEGVCRPNHSRPGATSSKALFLPLKGSVDGCGDLPVVGVQQLEQIHWV